MDRVVEKCANCGKTIVQSAHGSLNSWLFRKAECKCEPGWQGKEQSLLQPTQPVDAPIGKHKAKEAGKSDPTVNRIDGDKRRDSLCGTMWDERYHIVERLGAGGWGAVYKAIDQTLNRKVAIKLLHPSMGIDTEGIARFRREATAVGALQHPNIVVVFDWNASPNGQPYIVMELLEGRPLSDILSENGALKATEAIKILMALTDALAAAHKQGIIHRDLKPSNIVVVKNRDGDLIPKIVDFGLAKVMNLEGVDEKSLTATGQLVGTVYYLSPEQCRGMPTDERSDIYALGCVMYEMLTGRRAFEAPDMFTCIHKHFNDYPPAFAEIAPHIFIPRGLEALEDIVFQALHKKPERRFQSMEELHDALQSLDIGNQGIAVDKRRGVRGRRPTRSRSRLSVGWTYEFPDLLRVVALVTVVSTLLLAATFAWVAYDGPGTDIVLSALANGDARQQAYRHIALAEFDNGLGARSLAKRHALNAMNVLQKFAMSTSKWHEDEFVLADLGMITEEFQLAGADVNRICIDLGDHFVKNDQPRVAYAAYALAWKLADPTEIGVPEYHKLGHDCLQLLEKKPLTETDSQQGEINGLRALAMCSIREAAGYLLPVYQADTPIQYQRALELLYGGQGRWRDEMFVAHHEISSLLRANDRGTAAYCMTIVGDCYLNLGDQKQAEAWYKEAVRYALGSGAWGIEAEVNSHLAEFYKRQGDLAQADAYGTRAVNVVMAAQSPVPASIYQSYVNLIISSCADTYIREGQLAKVEALYQRGLHFYDMRPNIPEREDRQMWLLDRYADLLKTVPNRSKDLEQLRLRQAELMHAKGAT